MDDAFLRAVVLLLVLLNPFLTILYLLDLVERLGTRTFVRALVQAAVIAGAAFSLFAFLGEFVFEMLQVSFASFQIFGGVVLLIVGVRYVMNGTKALAELRGTETEQLAGSIAMPILIGPGTVSAAVLVGNQLPIAWSLGAIWLAMALVVAGLVGLKVTHDAVAPRNGALVRRYVDIAGRVGALLVGSFGIEMIMVGVAGWVEPIVRLAGWG